jgi:uncharacterized membrane protein YoaT (DUF817 family)
MLARKQTRFHAIRVRLEHHRSRGRVEAFCWEFALFVFKQAWACLFGGILLTLILVTKYLWPAHARLARYDFLFLAALALQVVLLMLRMETVREAKVILAFHLIGTGMELFKTSVGSWSYPEHNLFRVGHVPLFSGFMYASVGSFMARTTRILDMRYRHFPSRAVTIALAVLIYANFFANHFMRDMRLVLFALIAAAFGRTSVYYKPYRTYRRMPLLLGFGLVALCIWIAENVGTFGAVWVYPHQRAAWEVVRLSKLGSWLLLMIISFILVSLVHRPTPPPEAELADQDADVQVAEIATAE